MNQPKIFVTHVELSSSFIKIHGQTNHEQSQRIAYAFPTVANLFSQFPQPVIKMLYADCMVLVYLNCTYYRGKFVSADAQENANILLIDVGFMVTVEMSNIRVLGLAPKQADFLLSTPAQASEFILNRCIISNDALLSKIQDEILHCHIPYSVDDEISPIKRISLTWKGCDYVEHLVKSKVCQPLTPDKQLKFLVPKSVVAPIARPVNKYSNDTNTVRSSINPTGIKSINNYLNTGLNKVPQNMPSYQPKISVSMDFNSNRTNKQTSQPVNNQNNQTGAHLMPTFISDTLLLQGRHHVYVSYVEDGPYMFSVQLKSSTQRMEQMMADIANIPQLKQLSRKPALGMACLARYSGDNRIYRAAIKSIYPDSCRMMFVDCGNSEKVLFNHIYDIPDQFLRLKTFAIRVSLAGLKQLPSVTDKVKSVFTDMVTDKEFEMLVVSPDGGNAFLQCCELFQNGQSLLNRLKDVISDIPKFIEPTAVTDDDFVVIRFVDSPKLFCVQQTKNIKQYDAMMDRLCVYCMTAPALQKIQKDAACAARYRNDSEWYRAEIVSVNGSNALIRFVDYGIEVMAEISTLKEISDEFLIMPKQAVRCCLYGFDAIQIPSSSSQDQMELLAEDSVGERRNFRVKMFGKFPDAILVNLIDESQMPHLDLSMRMLQLSMPQKSFRQYELKLQNKVPNSRPTNAPAANPSDAFVNTSSEVHLSDSGYQGSAPNSSRQSNWDTPKRDQRNDGHNNNNKDIRSSIDCSSNSSSVSMSETFKADPKESKFYKSQHYVNPSIDSNEQRNVRPVKLYTSSNERRDNLKPEGPIDPKMEIPIQPILMNKVVDVKLAWLFSPLDFYVTTVKSDADLEYTIQMKNIHHFYKNKSPMTKKAETGSLVIAKYSKNNQLHRAKIIDFNEALNKYKAQLIDLGALTIVDAADVYEMDKIFAKLECQAIKCSFDGVAISASRFDMEESIEKLMANKRLDCRFNKKKDDTYYVDITVDGSNVKTALIKSKILSILDEDIELERLVGQTVMAEVKSFKNLSSFKILICGCETLFEACCQSANTKSDDKKLLVDKVIPMRIESFALGKSFIVTPLIDIFGEAPPSPICNFSFFANNFKVGVTHWESCNVAYVHCEHVRDLPHKLLDDLYSFYEEGGDLLQHFTPLTLCAAKSADENWYRAEIVSETQPDVRVRYLDYGNCEVIPKNLVKCLDSKFYDTPALAVKVYLPLTKVYNDREASMDEIAKLTADDSLDLKVMDFHAQNWIVDMLKDNHSITTVLKTKTSCKTISVAELKKQINDFEVSQKVSRMQVQKSKNNQQIEAEIVEKITQPTTEPENTQTASQQLTPLDNQISVQAPTISTKTKAIISHIDRPDRFFLQISSTKDALYQLQDNIQIVAPSLPPLEDFSNDTRCIVRYSVDNQWYRAVIIDSDMKITSILFIDYGNTDSITDNSLIKSMSDAFDQIPAYAIPCALPLEARDRIEWSEESCDLFKNLVNMDDELEFEFVCKGKSNNFVKLYQGDRDVMQEFIQNGHAVKLDSITSGAKCYMSHVNSISDFYIQMESDTYALEKLSDYLHDASKFEVMTDVKQGVVCSAKYMEDGSWYRGKIMSHKANTTEVFFIDYGNASVTNELRIIPTEIANAPAIAKYCSLVKPKDIQYWSESAERRFVELTDNGAVFEVDVISPGKKSVVDLISNDLSIVEEISNLCDKYTVSALEKTLQSSADTSVTRETFKATIVDGAPQQFYIQLESTSSELDKLWVSMEPASTWPSLETVEVGQMCAALYDGSYYRAKALSVDANGVTVHYIDYGNQSLCSDLRKLPEDLQNIKPLAISCTLESQNGTFSPELTDRFANLSREVPLDLKFISKNSNPAIVQLFENGVLFGEQEISELTESFKLKAYISHIIGPNHFYIQMNNEMEEAMASASEFPVLEDSNKCLGKICAALWEGYYYRAEILAIDENGTKVQFIDYGNESYATDLRKLPDNLEEIERASILCTLENENDTFGTEFVNKFTSLNCDNEYEFEVITRSSPCVVRLYINGEIFSDGNVDSNIPKSSQSEANSDSISILNEVIEEVIEAAIVSEKSLNTLGATDNSSTTITHKINGN